MESKQILVVDDEIGIRELLSEILFDEGYRVHMAESAEQARIYRNGREPDLVLLDIWMPDTDGITLLREWVDQDLLTMPVVMMSGHGTVETAVEATRIGAVDFLEKPIALQKLLSTISKALKEYEPKSQPSETAIQKIAPNIDGRDTAKIDGQADERQLLHINMSLDMPLREAREHFDSIYFDYHLRKETGNVSRVADKVGLERTHLYRKLKQLGIKFAKKGGPEES